MFKQKLSGDKSYEKYTYSIRSFLFEYEKDDKLQIHLFENEGEIEKDFKSLNKTYI
jgi:hypothetical protein